MSDRLHIEVPAWKIADLVKAAEDGIECAIPYNPDTIESQAVALEKRKESLERIKRGLEVYIEGIDPAHLA